MTHQETNESPHVRSVLQLFRSTKPSDLGLLRAGKCRVYSLQALEAFLRHQKSITPELRSEVFEILKNRDLLPRVEGSAKNLLLNVQLWNETNALGHILERLATRSEIALLLQDFFSAEQLATCRAALELRQFAMEARRYKDERQSWPVQNSVLLPYLQERVGVRKYPLESSSTFGLSLPLKSLHGTSVLMPTMKGVLRYEEGDPATLRAMKTGYPRFKFPPQVEKLKAKILSIHGNPGEDCLPFPTARVAQRAMDFCRRHGIAESRQCEVEDGKLHAVFVPKDKFPVLKSYWTHCGEIVSSRQASAVLRRKREVSKGLHDAVTQKIIRQISLFTGQPTSNIFLFPTGMAASFAAFRLVQEMGQGANKLPVQFGFSYVDTPKIHSKWTNSSRFYPRTTENDYLDLREKLAGTSGIFCEVPSNPLCNTIDLVRISRLARTEGVPVVCDETLGSFVNTNPFPYADIVTSSSTKYLSGGGNVMGGVVVISAASPLQADILKKMKDLHEPEMTHFDDLVTLSRNMRDYESRMRRINQNASQLIEWLQGEECLPFIESLHYPSLDESENYKAILREGGGYGGLFSIVLKGGSEAAATFYDNLQVLKGPSLGCNFTLACPYTLLAHFGELEWVEKQGISRNLIRVSVGLEDIEELQKAFRAAFSALTTSSLLPSQQ